MGNYLGQLMKNTKYKNITPKKLEDKWFLSRLNSLKKKVNEALEAIHTHKAVEAIEDFFLEDFSRGYLQFVRERIASSDQKEREEVLSVFYKVFLGLLQTMSPFTPFLTEHLYQKHLKTKTESIHLLDWPKVDKELINTKLEEQMKTAQEVIKEALSQREQLKKGLKWPLQTLTVNCDEKIKKSVSVFLDLIKTQVNVKEIKIKKATKFSVSLDKKLTKELLAEGYANQVMRLVQVLRKKAEMKKEGKISLFVSVPDVDLKLFEKDIKERCGAKTVSYQYKECKDSLSKTIEEKEVKVGFEKV